MPQGDFRTSPVLHKGAARMSVMPAASCQKMEDFRELVAGARSYRRFDESKKMTMEELKSLVDLARMSPCGANKQYLKYAVSCDESVNAKIFPAIGWAAALPDWDGPAEGERPTGYILMLRDKELQKNLTVDEGIAAQSIFLGARAMGYGGCMLMNIKRGELLDIFGLDPERYEVSMLIALGVPAEKVVMVPVTGGKTTYYRDENQVHYVPKRSLEDILIVKCGC